MSLQTLIDEQNRRIEQARREGWEQCQKECVEKVEYIHKNSLGSKILLAVAADAITTMEYKEG